MNQPCNTATTTSESESLTFFFLVFLSVWLLCLVALLALVTFSSTSANDLTTDIDVSQLDQQSSSESGWEVVTQFLDDESAPFGSDELVELESDQTNTPVSHTTRSTKSAKPGKKVTKSPPKPAKKTKVVKKPVKARVTKKAPKAAKPTKAKSTPIGRAPKPAKRMKASKPSKATAISSDEVALNVPPPQRLASHALFTGVRKLSNQKHVLSKSQFEELSSFVKSMRAAAQAANTKATVHSSAHRFTEVDTTGLITTSLDWSWLSNLGNNILNGLDSISNTINFGATKQLEDRAADLDAVNAGTLKPNPNSRLGAYAATAGYREGSVGHAIHGCIGLIYFSAGSSGEYQIGSVFNRPDVKARYGESIQTDASYWIASQEWQYWCQLYKKDPRWWTGGTTTGCVMVPEIRNLFQKFIC